MSADATTPPGGHMIRVESRCTLGELLCTKREGAPCVQVSAERHREQVVVTLTTPDDVDALGRWLCERAAEMRSQADDTPRDETPPRR